MKLCCIQLALRQIFRLKLFAKQPLQPLFSVTNLRPAVEQTCELVDRGEHLQEVLQPHTERVKSAKDVFLAETELLCLLHNLERMSNLHVDCKPAQRHLFVLDLLVSLSVVRVQLDALAQLALDHFSILQKKVVFFPLKIIQIPT